MTTELRIVERPGLVSTTYTVWNGIRFLGTLKIVGSGGYMFVAPTIVQPLYPDELTAIAEKLRSLNTEKADELNTIEENIRLLGG